VVAIAAVRIVTKFMTLLRGFDRVLVAEMNAGQLVTLLRNQYLVPAEGINKVAGKSFKVAELEEAVTRSLERRS
jgi:2-oxoglutarate ferredoxin oxidoreductase subunit alpha